MWNRFVIHASAKYLYFPAACYFPDLMKICTVCREALVTVVSVSRRSPFGGWDGGFKDPWLSWGYVESYWTLVRNMKSSFSPHPGYAPKFPDNFLYYFRQSVLNENHTALSLKTHFCLWLGIGWRLRSEPARQWKLSVYYNLISVHPNMLNPNILNPNIR